MNMEETIASEQKARTDVAIDKHRLDYEWVRQSELYHDYAVRLADACKARDKAKAKVDVAKAEAELDIRQTDPKEYKFEKYTEAIIVALVATHPTYKAAVRTHIDAKHDADVLGAAVSALDQKKRALENLVELHGRDYFSEPVARSPEGREQMGNAAKTEVRSRARRQCEE